jgi:hypothetical protein
MGEWLASPTTSMSEVAKAVALDPELEGIHGESSVVLQMEQGSLEALVRHNDQ